MTLGHSEGVEPTLKNVRKKLSQKTPIKVKGSLYLVVLVIVDNLKVG